jgi:hypothetical protein
MGKFIVNDQRTIECAKKGAAKTMSLYGKGHLLKIVADYRRAHPSNLEAAVADMLNGMGVFFDSNAVIGEICVADFLLGNKVIIETDGEYWHNQRQASDAARDTKLQAATSLANRAADHFGEMDAEGGASAAYVKLAKQVVSAHVEDKGGTYPTVGMRVRWTTGGQQYSGTVTARKGKQVVVAYYLGGGKPITATLDVSDLMNPRS